ncbi:MAG: DUF488 domain-containing protein [Nitrososphaerales archaeon]
MPVKTKSIYEKREDSDGIRVLVSRFYPRGVKRSHFDSWIRDASPEANLLKDYRNKLINWRVFSTKFRRQLKSSQSSKEAIERIAKWSKSETVTLLCYEKEGEKCHRHIVKSIVDRKHITKDHKSPSARLDGFPEDSALNFMDRN